MLIFPCFLHDLSFLTAAHHKNAAFEYWTSILETWWCRPFSITLYRVILHQTHGLRTLRQKIAFTARPKIQPQSQIFRYGRSISYLPHRPKFSDFFDLCLHWESVVRGFTHTRSELLCTIHERNLLFLASIFFSYLLTVF